MSEVVELIPKNQGKYKQIVTIVMARRLWICTKCNRIINRGEKYTKVTEKRWGLKRGFGMFWRDEAVEIICSNCKPLPVDKER